jgi:hypothetical protein
MSTAACGYAALLSVLLAHNKKVCEPLPRGKQLDWEAIFAENCKGEYCVIVFCCCDYFSCVLFVCFVCLLYCGFEIVLFVLIFYVFKSILLLIHTNSIFISPLIYFRFHRQCDFLVPPNRRRFTSRRPGRRPQ